MFLRTILTLRWWRRFLETRIWVWNFGRTKNSNWKIILTGTLSPSLKVKVQGLISTIQPSATTTCSPRSNAKSKPSCRTLHLHCPWSSQVMMTRSWQAQGWTRAWVKALAQFLHPAQVILVLQWLTGQFMRGKFGTRGCVELVIRLRLRMWWGRCMLFTSLGFLWCFRLNK